MEFTGQLLDGTKYDEWSCRMKMTLRAAGSDIWKSVVTGYTAPKQVKTITQKDARKNNSMEKELILEGLTNPMKRRIGNCLTTKELWDSLEQLCSKGDFKENFGSVKTSPSGYVVSSNDLVTKSSPEVDHCSHGNEEEEGVDLATSLDEIIFLHKLIEKQTKKISLLQCHLEEKEIPDEENENVKADL